MLVNISKYQIHSIRLYAKDEFPHVETLTACTATTAVAAVVSCNALEIVFGTL